MMNRVIGLFVFTLVVGALGAGCSDSYGHLGTSSRLVIDFVRDNGGQPVSPVGAPDKPLPLTFDASAPIALNIVAMRLDGTRDTAYNGYVRVSVKPGTVVNLSGSRVSGRNVLLQGGVAEGIAVSIAGSFGPTHIWAEDAGYTPVDPRRTPPPQCSDGIDNNNNGTIDFPADPGCAFANDDAEDLGTFAAGTSPTVWFTSPRIADVRGVSQGGAGTSFPHQQVALDTGYHPKPDVPSNFDFSVIVTRVASDGFYVTDINDTRGYASVFAYNFSAPAKMRVCDRLKSFGGTASDFFGFTEIGFPTWQLEEWDPAVRPCLIPEPHVLSAGELQRSDAGTLMNTQPLLMQIAAMVRAESDPSKKVDVHVTQHFGPGFPRKETNYAPEDGATNCDLNGDGKVDFSADPEKTCTANCGADRECTEYANFLSRSAFNLVVTAPDPNTGFPLIGSIQANGSTSARFDPVALRGQAIHSFTGTLRYFSGGTQFTIEARCEDDIVVKMEDRPFDSGRACVHARTDSDNNSASN